MSEPELTLIEPEPLLPCPFCAGTDSEDNACQMAKVVIRSFNSVIGKRAYRVECGCGAIGPPDLDFWKARENWNRRKYK